MFLSSCNILVRMLKGGAKGNDKDTLDTESVYDEDLGTRCASFVLMSF
jgi:hypothetical protein